MSKLCFNLGCPRTAGSDSDEGISLIFELPLKRHWFVPSDEATIRIRFCSQACASAFALVIADYPNPGTEVLRQLFEMHLEFLEQTKSRNVDLPQLNRETPKLEISLPDVTRPESKESVRASFSVPTAGKQGQSQAIVNLTLVSSAVLHQFLEQCPTKLDLLRWLSANAS